MAFIVLIVILVIVIGFASKKDSARSAKTEAPLPPRYSFEPSNDPESLVMLNPSLRKPVFESKFLEVCGSNKASTTTDIDYLTRDFLVFDFETANNSRESACAVGIAIVKDLQVVDTKHFFISPQHNSWFKKRFIDLHGISWEQVYDQPFFNDVWLEIEELFKNNLLLAYNLSFDMDVLKGTLNYYGIPLPELKCNCALQYARKHISGPSDFKLSTVCEFLGVSLNHHQAESDALAAANVMIHIIDGLKKAHEKQEVIRLQNEEKRLRKEKLSELMSDEETAKKINSLTRGIRRSRQALSENPENEHYIKAYVDYKKKYYDITGEEFKEKQLIP